MIYYKKAPLKKIENFFNLQNTADLFMSISQYDKKSLKKKNYNQWGQVSKTLKLIISIKCTNAYVMNVKN